MLILIIPVTSLTRIDLEAHSNFVSETDDFIVVENDYYLAQIRKDTKPGSRDFGIIEHLFIKPSNHDVVAEDTGPHGMGAYEYIQEDPPSPFWATWGKITPHELRVLKSETDYTVVFVNFTLGQQMIATYYTFFKDEPYYLVNAEHKWLYNVFVDQFQTCFLFNRHWATTMRFLNESGHVETHSAPLSDEYYARVMYQVEINNKTLRWSYFENAHYSEGVGMIFLGIHPREESTTILNHFKGVNSSYCEWEITIDDINGFPREVFSYDITGKIRYSYLIYLTSDFEDVKRLAETLWSPLNATEVV